VAARTEVVDFLSLFKGCLMLGNFDIKDRQKNRQALIDLDMTPDQRREILLGLEPENYVAGPHPDDTDQTKEVWIFGKRLENVEIYIKMRVVRVPGRQNVYRALLWSFHPAEHELDYPLRR